MQMWKNRTGISACGFNRRRATGIDERLDPAKNLVAGAKYIRQMLDEFSGATEDDHWKIAMTAYTAGEGTVRKALRIMGVDSDSKIT